MSSVSLIDGHIDDDKKQTPRGIDTADLVEVVRCKDCIYYDDGECTYLYGPECRIFCESGTANMDKNDYCSYGERRDT